MHIPTFVCIFILFWTNILLLLLYPKHIIKPLGYNLGCYVSPRTRRIFTTIGTVLASWVIPRGTLGSPSPTHLHHHHNSPQRQLPHLTSRTRCSPLLSALMLYGMRPRSTESSSSRIWRSFALICIRCWPTRPLFFSSSIPSRPSLLSSWHSTSRHPHHRSDPSITRGVLFTLYCSFVASGEAGYFCFGGCE